MNTKKNLQNIIFLLVIFIMLVSPLIFWLSLNGRWNEDSILEDRKLVSFPPISFRDFKTSIKRIYQGLYSDAGELFFNQFLDETFQRKVNKAAAEQAPLRIPLVETAKFFERVVIKSAYLALPDQAIPASMDSQMYITRDDNNLLQEVAFFNNQKKQDIDVRVANYRDLLEKFPAINFYVFNIETLPYSKFHPMAVYFPQADNGQSLQYFLTHKPENLRFENFALTSFQDYQDRFFRTDQHWNIRASLDAYQQIYQMLQEKYPDISPMVEAKSIKKVANLSFRGSLARKTLYPVQPDILEYAQFDLMDYLTYVDNNLTTYSDREKYFNGTFNQEKFYNHYRGFYGKQQIQIQYQFENGSDRNLLMITSSYSRTIQMVLASHFHNTYVIDLRFEDNSSKSLQDYIKEYQITDVLIFGQPTVTYYSAEDAIKP
jgi:hypothetical protein